MANTFESQDEAIYNAKDDAALTGSQTNNTAYLAASGDPAGTTGTLTVVSATAKQVSTKRNAMVYVNITTAAALAIVIGPTSTPAIPVSISQSSALGVVSFELPAGWYLKCTGTVTNYVVTYVLR